MYEEVRQNYELAEVDYMAGMKYKDIAEKYGVTINTVKSWKTRYKWSKDKKSVHTKSKKVRTQKIADAEGRSIDEVIERAEISNPNINENQKLFCLYFVKYRNKVKAYQKAYGCSYENACSHASDLWKKGEVQKEIQRLLDEYRSGVDLDIKDLFQWYLDIARADINDFVKFNGSFIGMKEQIEGTLVSEVSETANGIKIKLNDRMKAMEWIGEHIGLADERQRAEIAVLKAKVEPNTDLDEADDGFINALNSSAGEDWANEE